LFQAQSLNPGRISTNRNDLRFFKTPGTFVWVSTTERTISSNYPAKTCTGDLPWAVAATVNLSVTFLEFGLSAKS
jgi:hypothetical protein